MCVNICECNSCIKKYTCTDCEYNSSVKNVNCHTKGVQGCPHFRSKYIPTDDKKKVRGE